MNEVRLNDEIAQRFRSGDGTSRLYPGVAAALLGVLILLWLLYAGFSIDTALRMRTRSVLERNQALAQLASRLLDEQSNAALRALRHLADRKPLQAALRKGARGTIREHLKDTVELVPGLLFVAAYRPDGAAVTSYSRGPLAGGASMVPRWFKPEDAGKAPFFARVVRLRDRNRTLVLSLAVPIPQGRDPRRSRGDNAYLLAYYHLRGVDAWVRRYPAGSNTDLYVLDSSNLVVTGSGESFERPMWNGFEPLRRARTRIPGAIMVKTPWDGRDALVGYAFAGVPGWSVLVVQPNSAAMAPANYLLIRLFALLLPVLLLIGIGTRGMARLYRQQQRMTGLLTRQNDDLRAIGTAKSDFLANVSHDLGTPLTNIQVALSGLLDPAIPWEPAQVRDCLRIATEEVEMLKTRVRNLLEMSRIDAKAYTYHNEPCDLADVASVVLERLEPLLRDHPLTVEFPDGPLLIEGDQSRMETVLRNLLENAIKYSPSGGRIFLRGTRRAGSAVISVRDEGPGIPVGDEARIFTKFYRAKGSLGGTGLGLAICQAIISEHRGMITAHNAAGGGAEFYVLLPLLYPQSLEGSPSGEGVP
jgi:signal transduction histidine kinase